MKCEKCQDLGIIEKNYGLEFSYCDCEIGKAIEAKKRAIYGIPEEVINATDSGTNRDYSNTRSPDTSESPKPKKRKKRKKARKRLG